MPLKLLGMHRVKGESRTPGFDSRCRHGDFSGSSHTTLPVT